LDPALETMKKLSHVLEMTFLLVLSWLCVVFKEGAEGLGTNLSSYQWVAIFDKNIVLGWNISVFLLITYVLLFTPSFCILRFCRFADLSIFYRNFHGHCSHEIQNIIPDPVRRVKTTRSYTYSHPFQITLPNPQTLSHKSSFIPRPSQLWNSLPPTTFPES